jgi:ribosome-associated protein YbcJ (S4-like RNA binding protein)
MSNKITIIKVLGADGKVTVQDLEKWRKLFSEGMTAKDAVETGEVAIEVIEDNRGEEDHYITLVKVGGENYSPTMEDLDNWRQVFEAAKNDPDFKIFTHPSIQIDVINIGNIIAVE